VNSEVHRFDVIINHTKPGPVAELVLAVTSRMMVATDMQHIWHGDERRFARAMWPKKHILLSRILSEAGWHCVTRLTFTFVICFV